MPVQEGPQTPLEAGCWKHPHVPFIQRCLHASLSPSPPRDAFLHSPTPPPFTFLTCGLDGDVHVQRLCILV